MKPKYVPIEKRSKKERKALNAELRVMVGFNCGTRIHGGDKRHLNRSAEKRKALKGECE